RLDVGALAAGDVIAHGQALGSEDVGLLTVGVVQQRDPAGAVRVVLDRGDLGGDAVLHALEVDDPVLALVPTAAVTGGLAPVDVAAARARRRREQSALGSRLGDFGE